MLLVINAGSSSIKLAVFDASLAEIARGHVEEIAQGGHGVALANGLRQTGLNLPDLTAVAHRVVHGGAHLTAPCRIDASVIAKIEAGIALAPLHNSANLIGITAVTGLAPDVPQFASFDTAFHATNPDVATHYAIPEADAAIVVGGKADFAFILFAADLVREIVILRARHRMRKLVETEFLQSGNKARQLLAPEGAEYHLGRARRAGARGENQDQSCQVAAR